MPNILANLSPQKPVLIAGPTASGKSALALYLAQKDDRLIINADALQVYDGWRLLTARPDDGDLAKARHALYGHISAEASYSVGDWLRETAELLSQESSGAAPIIIGGTGLYFRALTEGLADIPATLPATRALADHRMADEGLPALLNELDAATAARIDRQNPMRVQRAWEVQHQTGRGLADWQDATPPPILPLSQTHAFVVQAPKDWLNARIDLRFERMMQSGALDEARAMLPRWNPEAQSSRAIGAAPLIESLQGKLPINEAVKQAQQASRQYAKRQRTWFRARMSGWLPIDSVAMAELLDDGLNKKATHTS